jgi:hypothetical protein
MATAKTVPGGHQSLDARKHDFPPQEHDQEDGQIKQDGNIKQPRFYPLEPAGLAEYEDSRQQGSKKDR